MKAGGVVYTPPRLAEFLALQTFSAYDGRGPVRILDPACGDGELLLAAVTEADRRSIKIESLVGYDIDESAVAVAAERLAGIPAVSLHHADFMELAAANAEPSNLFDVNGEIEQQQFDVVISNPPYVRTQTLGSGAAQILGRRFGLTGRVDLYQAFSVAMVQALVPGGALGLLCSNKFLTNRAGTAMRKMLLTELELREIVDLGDTKLFDAAVLPVIISGSRDSVAGSRERVRFRSVYEAKPGSDTGSSNTDGVLGSLTNDTAGFVEEGGRCFFVRDGELDLESGAGQPWNPVDTVTKAKFEILRRNASRQLGDVGKIRVGVKTTADPVFIRSDWIGLGDDEMPESELLRPLITHREVAAWEVTAGPQQILYPHFDREGKSAAIDLADYPGAATYLEKHRSRLEGRKYVTDAGRNWYEIWVPQKPALWAQPKIVFPDIAESPRFAVDVSGAVVNGDCYWIVIEDDGLREVVTAVGNSSFCTWFYDAACGNFLYAGRRRFMTQYMERLPIPEPTDQLVDEIRTLRANGDEEELDSLIWSALGLKKSLV